MSCWGLEVDLGIELHGEALQTCAPNQQMDSTQGLAF